MIVLILLDYSSGFGGKYGVEKEKQDKVRICGHSFLILFFIIRNIFRDELFSFMPLSRAVGQEENALSKTGD